MVLPPWTCVRSGRPLREVTSSHEDRRSRGLTVIELLLVIATIVIIGVLVTPALAGFLVRNHWRNTTSELLSAFRTAQLNAMTGKRDHPWGTHISATTITLFQGASFISRVTAFDEVYEVPPSITITPAEIVFAKLTGNPGAPATIAVQDSVGDSITVSVNAVGTVDVN